VLLNLEENTVATAAAACGFVFKEEKVLLNQN